MLIQELKTIGNHIRKRRLDLKLNQKDVAHILGVDECSVWNRENEKSYPANYSNNKDY